MFFETSFERILENYDFKGCLTAQAMLKMFENAGNRHSDLAGDAVIARSASGVTWVLTEWDVRIKEYPRYENKLQVKTWIEKPSSSFGCSRNYEFFSDGKLCAEASAKWVLFDMKANKLARLRPELIASYEPEDKTVFGGVKSEKVTVPEVFDSETEIAIRRSDIDFNNHVHNLCYLDYALETLPMELYESADFRNIRIVYKNALANEKIAICKQKTIGCKSTVAIFSLNGTLCTLVELSSRLPD